MGIRSFGSYTMKIFLCLHQKVSTSSMMSFLVKAPFKTSHKQGIFCRASEHLTLASGETSHPYSLEQLDICLVLELFKNTVLYKP